MSYHYNNNRYHHMFRNRMKRFLLFPVFTYEITEKAKQ